MEKTEYIIREFISLPEEEIWNYTKGLGFHEYRNLYVRLQNIIELVHGVKLKKQFEKVEEIKDEPGTYPPEDLKTVAEISKVVNLSEVTIYKHIKKGKIKALSIGDKWRIPLSQFKIDK